MAKADLIFYFLITVLKHRAKTFYRKSILPCPLGQWLSNFKYKMALAVNRNSYKQAHNVSCVINNSWVKKLSLVSGMAKRE